jgi:hypothetical protein
MAKTVAEVIEKYKAKDKIEYNRIVVHDGIKTYTYFNVSNIIKTKNMISFNAVVFGQRDHVLVRINDGSIIVSEEV